VVKKEKGLDPLEQTLYQLAENLNTPVYELKKNMPSSELTEWIEFHRQKADDKKQQEEVKKGNLMAMDEDQLAATFVKRK